MLYKEGFSTDAVTFFLCFLLHRSRISACEVLLCYYMNMDKGSPPLDIKRKNKHVRTPLSPTVLADSMHFQGD